MSFELLNELLQLTERRNHLGEVEYTSFSSWKRACRKAEASVWFDGDVDICNAFVGPRPYKRAETRAIGEWDGDKGSLFVEPKSDGKNDIADAPEDKAGT